MHMRMALSQPDGCTLGKLEIGIAHACCVRMHGGRLRRFPMLNDWLYTHVAKVTGRGQTLVSEKCKPGARCCRCTVALQSMARLCLWIVALIDHGQLTFSGDR